MDQLDNTRIFNRRKEKKKKKTPPPLVGGGGFPNFYKEKTNS